MVDDTPLVQIIPGTTILNKAEVTLNAKVTALSEEYLALKVIDGESNTRAHEALARLRTFLKQIESRRKSYLEPINQYIKYINSRFFAVIQPIEKAEHHLISEISNYRRLINESSQKEQDRLQRLAERRIKQAQTLGKSLPVPEAIAPFVPGAPKTIETDIGKITYRIEWKAEIIDESALPREYLMPNEAKINAIVRASKGSIQIPGVRIYSVEVPVIHK